MPHCLLPCLLRSINCSSITLSIDMSSHSFIHAFTYTHRIGCHMATQLSVVLVPAFYRQNFHNGISWMVGYMAAGSSSCACAFVCVWACFLVCLRQCKEVSMLFPLPTHVFHTVVANCVSHM